MSKKLLYTILAGALSISVLAACGEAGDGEPGDPGAPEPGIEEPAG